MIESNTRVVIERYRPFLMTDLPGIRNHCSITGLTAIFHYYSKMGYGNIPSDPVELFRIIEKTAIRRFSYFPWKYSPIRGTLPFRIDNLVRTL